MNDVILASDSWPQHWWFLFFPLFWLVVFACLFRFVLFRRSTGCWSLGDRPGPRGPQGILAERYARGEIGDEEYRTRLDRLRADARA
jgi:putative membrane protein